MMMRPGDCTCSPEKYAGNYLVTASSPAGALMMAASVFLPSRSD
jgi:hypothetical protein